MAHHDGPSDGTAGELLTQKQYAQRKGWSKQYVNQLVKKGRIPLQDGRINPASADAALARDRDPAQDRAFKAAPLARDAPQGESSQSDPPTHHGSFSRARTVREHFRALRERLDYEYQSGKLVPAEQVETACFEAARNFRDSFGVAAIKIGQAIAGKYKLDEQEVVAIMTAEVKTTLAELSRRFKEQCLDYKEPVPLEPED